MAQTFLKKFLASYLDVLYHMRNPLLALERVFSVTKRQLILETVVDCMTINRPVIAFYPGAELNNDGSNWCGPNRAAVEAMLKTVGFNRVEMVYRQFNGEPSQLNLDLDRMTFHAWR
jgi:tRNA (mo5U34)-methyltransferase